MGSGLSAPAEDEVKVRAGTLGARARWGDGPPRIVRLDDLSAPQRRVVLALLAAVRKEADPVIETPGSAHAEGHASDAAAS